MTAHDDRLRRKAREEGFEQLRIADPEAATQAGARLEEFLSFGREGDMGWLRETAARRASPLTLWPEARSAVMLAMSYAPEIDPLERLKAKETGVISVYALGRDYHDVIKGKLKHLAQWLARETGQGVKVFVDTAPLMEKPLAEAAGLGWQGRHTNLVSRELGSWFFLGAILSEAALVRDEPESDHCGSCRACLDICPTRAFPQPYQLDARRCIS
jgi:epoxyqueuosine reductase